MSASQNAQTAKSVSNQTGEVGSHVAPTGAIETTGHQPGKLVGNDKIPTAHAETLPAGTAPKSATFTPNPVSETPGQAGNPLSNVDGGAGQTKASDTIPGATSADVNTGYGHPGQGQTSAELHHDGKAHRERQGGGLQGVGASGAPTGDAPREGHGQQMGINRPARDDKET